MRISTLFAHLIFASLAFPGSANRTGDRISNDGRDDELRQADVFVAGQGGYHTYRIPSVIATPKGTWLAFCEGRKHGRGDAGDIDLLSKRSTDGGKTWSDAEVVWDDAENTCGNPCPVVDRDTGTIWLLLTHNLGKDTEAQIIDQTSQALVHAGFPGATNRRWSNWPTAGSCSTCAATKLTTGDWSQPVPMEAAHGPNPSLTRH